jgi:hypothetical protein
LLTSIRPVRVCRYAQYIFYIIGFAQAIFLSGADPGIPGLFLDNESFLKGFSMGTTVFGRRKGGRKGGRVRSKSLY